MSNALRDKILNAQDLKREAVVVPEWDGVTVYVRTLTGAERDAFESSILDAAGKVTRDNARAKLVGRCVVDEAGGRVFDEADIAALGRKSASALDRLFSVASRLNGLSNKDVEELEKNSGTGPSAGSTSDSH